MKHAMSAAVLATFSLTAATAAQGASFLFAESQGDPDIVTHVKGYSGAGGVVTVTVGIDQTSVFAPDMAISVQNAVNTFNAMIPTTNNFSFGQLSSNQLDFESVMIHELGHSLGLAHTNTASESGLSGSNRRYAKTLEGTNGNYDLNPGADNVIGTSDDVRGDDENLIWFSMVNNDPFDTNLGTVDSTTYSQDLADLPIGDLFPAIATREVAAQMGYGNTEAVMVQGSVFGEIQRSLAAQDVAGMLYAQSGLDSIAGTADDYMLDLQFVGEVSAADILIDFDNTQTALALSRNGGRFLSSDDVEITSSNIYFNTNYDWFFNNVSNMPAVPLPASVFGLLFGLGSLCVLKRRARASRA